VEGKEDVGCIPFARMWIRVVAVGTMELVVERIYNLSTLSERETEQLATDADYVGNVLVPV